jgi:hypothetical protein
MRPGIEGKGGGMKNAKGKGRGVLRLPKAGTAAVIAALVMVSCASRPVVDSWGDAVLVAEQRLVIEQQQRRYEEMGRVIDEIQSWLGRAIDQVTASLAGNGELKSQFAEIDAFVRAVIEGKRKLEELQRADSREDAGEG